ncbi:MAG: DUF4097 family beta strand repeat protein [Clostridia bacterium]|nr:DUF4097 family beta strand repeat protein [Clostridia bacterium]
MNRNEFVQALPVTSIAARLIGAVLEVYMDDIDDIHVMVSGDERDVTNLRVQCTADQLLVEQPAASLAKNPVSTSWMQVTLRIPRSWKGSIEARTVSGWMNIRGVNGADLAMETVSGMLMASDVSFIAASIRSVTGDIKITGLTAERCSLSSTSGSVLAAATSLRSGSANTVTGGVTLSLTEPFEEISANSVSGDIRIEAPIDACDAVLRSVSGRIRTSGVSIVEGAAKVRATTVAGDLDITQVIYE